MKKLGHGFQYTVINFDYEYRMERNKLWHMACIIVTHDICTHPFCGIIIDWNN